MKGKAYVHRSGHPLGDFYSTPKSTIWVAEKIIRYEFPKDVPLLEPCCGKGAISEALRDMGYAVTDNDLFQEGLDYLQPDTFLSYHYAITNPPFSQWDAFIQKMKQHLTKFMVIGRLNYLGTNSRYKRGR